MEDEFEAWLASQGASLRKVIVKLEWETRGEFSEEAMNAVMDELLKRFEEGDKISETPSKFFSYIKTLARRKLYKLRRQSERRPAIDPGDVDWVPDLDDPGRSLREEEVWEVVRSTLVGVKYKHLEVHEIIRLIHWEHLEQKEVARRLGVTQVTITRAKQRGLTLLKELRPELMGEI